jgi:hypothetical protein
MIGTGRRRRRRLEMGRIEWASVWLAMRAPDIWVGPEAMSSVEEAPYDPER